ncbi:hypothetical protein Trydic_g2025 [Trypoxylus dichotomus]
MFDEMTYFSTLDLAQGFHQIEMDPEPIEKTAFVVNNGHYESRIPDFQTCWRLRLAEFQYKIQYKKGKENMVADALARIEINTKERVSNYDDADLLSVLANADLEDVTPDDYDEILAQNIGNPKPLDHFVNRVVLKLSGQYNIKFTRPFTKHYYLVNVRRGHEIERLTQSLRERNCRS